MGKNIIKMTLMTAVMFFGVFFINVDSAQAEGYAKCTYEGKKLTKTVGGNNLRSYYRFYRVDLAINRGDNDKFSGDVTVGCTDEILENERKDSAFKTDGTCYIHNVNIALKNNSKVLKKSFSNSGKMSCPDSIYIEYGDGFKSLGLNFSSGDKFEKFSITGTPKISETGSTSSSKEDAGGTIRADHANSANPENQADAYKPECGDECIANIMKWGEESDSEFGAEDADCTALQATYDEGKSIRNFLNNLLWIISIIGVILLIIMTAVEFIKVVTGQDDSGIIKAFKHTIIRIVCVIILLLLPVIIMAIVKIVNENSIGAKIGADGQVLCGVGEK